MTDVKMYAGILSGILAVSTCIPYLRSIFYGTTRPSIISQSLWGITALIAVVGQYAAAGFSWSMIIALAFTFNNLVIVMVCLSGYGYKGHTYSDIASAALAVCGLILWQLTDTALYAVLFAISAGLCAGFPTYHKLWRHPETENALAWFMVLLSGVLAFVALHDVSLVTVAYPLFTVLEAGLIVSLSLRRNTAVE